MADDGDDMLWATVGLLEKMPSMTPGDYNDLRMAPQAQGSDHHQMMNMKGTDMHGMSRGGDRTGRQDARDSQHTDHVPQQTDAHQ